MTDSRRNFELTALLGAAAALMPAPRGPRGESHTPPRRKRAGKPGKRNSRHGVTGPAWAHRKKRRG